MADILTDSLVFVLVVGGLGLPAVAQLQLQAGLKFCLAAVIGCIFLYLFGWSIYLLRWPTASFRVLVPVAVVALALRRKAVIDLLYDSGNRQIVLCWGIVAGWCLGFLALIRNSSGGEWIGDWFEHYHRTLFFLNRLPLETRFLNLYLLPARPPLANVVLSAFLGMTAPTFTNYQVFCTLLSTLVFIPTTLLARRFRSNSSRDPAAMVAVLFLLSPTFVENATFGWTKLPAAFFVLAALSFFLANEERQSGAAPMWVALCLATALLTHYSAAPFLIVLATIWLWRSRRDLASVAWWRSCFVPATVASALLATWFVWSALHFGFATLSSTSATTMNAGLKPIEAIGLRAANFFNLIVPHPLRPAEYAYLAQEGRLGMVRDYFFNLYQTNFFFVFGTGGIVILAVLVWRNRRRVLGFWGWFTAGILLLNAAVISWPDRWGSAHIGLQPLVYIGLAGVAAAWPELGTGLRRWLIGGLCTDFILGIALQFYVQHTDLSAEYANYSDKSLIPLRGFPTWINFFTKSAFHLKYLGEQGIPIFPLCAILALLLALAISMASHRDQERSPE